MHPLPWRKLRRAPANAMKTEQASTHANRCGGGTNIRFEPRAACALPGTLPSLLCASVLMERSFLQTQAGSLVVLKLNPDEQALVVVRPPFLYNLLSRYDSILDY